MTVSPEIYPSLSIAARKIYKDGGIGALYSGIAPTLIGMLPYSTCYYFMYETIKKSYCRAKNKESLNRVEMLLFGALSGMNLETQSLLVIMQSLQNPFKQMFYVLCLCLCLCPPTGLTASTISYPLEVARKRLMVGALQGKCPPNMVAALSEIVRVEGVSGLYRGWGASSLKVMPASGITWMFYEAWKDILLGGKQHYL